MVEQSHAVEYLVDRLGQQIANAQTAAERDKMGKAALNSQRLANALDHVNDERVHDKMESVQKNQALQDRVHISPEAQTLYKDHSSASAQVADKIHSGRQEPPEEPIVPRGTLGPMEPEA